MTLLDIIMLAVGLAMDCFSVSVVEGIRSHGSKFRLSAIEIWMIVSFGLFQGAMPLVGYYSGAIAEQLVNRYAGWVALVLLGAIGGKMVWDSFNKESTYVKMSFWQVMLLAVATSIDAAVSGILFITVPELLWKALTIIAVTSSLFSLIGYCVGHYIGKLPFNAERAGGIILILIGLKICFL